MLLKFLIYSNFNSNYRHVLRTLSPSRERCVGDPVTHVTNQLQYSSSAKHCSTLSYSVGVCCQRYGLFLGKTKHMILWCAFQGFFKLLFSVASAFGKVLNINTAPLRAVWDHMVPGYPEPDDIGPTGSMSRPERERAPTPAASNTDPKTRRDEGHRRNRV